VGRIRAPHHPALLVVDAAVVVRLVRLALASVKRGDMLMRAMMLVLPEKRFGRILRAQQRHNHVRARCTPV
jgi:hypothetical protein